MQTRFSNLLCYAIFIYYLKKSIKYFFEKSFKLIDRTSVHNLKQIKIYSMNLPKVYYYISYLFYSSF